MLSRSTITPASRSLAVRAQAGSEGCVAPPAAVALNRRQWCAILGSLPAVAVGTPRPAAALTPEEVTPTVVPPAPLTDRERAITDAFARANPAVVTIFDATLPGRAPIAGPAAIEQPEGNGSGFLWDSQGHVVTNYHVLANALGGGGGKLGLSARVATVLLLGADGLQQAYDGLLVGADKARDLVVLKINAPSAALPSPIPLGDAASLRIGQTVLAVGAPFGFEHTLTVGVVSALGRGFQSQTGSTIGGGIQTDAAINPGNSGGPLLDLSGRLVGINTAIFTNTGASAGVGFALPAETAARVVPQLIADGRVTRPSLGLTPAADPVARALGVTSGVLIQTVEPNGPAASAGLLPTRRGLSGVIGGDVIVRVGSKPVRSLFDLSAALDAAAVGDTVEVEALRGVGQGGSGPELVVFQVTLVAE